MMSVWKVWKTALRRVVVPRDTRCRVEGGHGCVGPGTPRPVRAGRGGWTPVSGRGDVEDVRRPMHRFGDPDPSDPVGPFVEVPGSKRIVYL